MAVVKVDVSEEGIEISKLIKRMSRIMGASVRVGYMGDMQRKEDDAEYINNPTLAYIHENGAPTAGIPARPFLEPALREAQPRIVKILEKSLAEALESQNLTFEDAKKIEAGYEMVGMALRDQAKEQIVQQRFAPLSEKTLEQRKRQKFKGTKALIRTGQLLNSITYDVKKE